MRRSIRQLVLSVCFTAVIVGPLLWYFGRAAGGQVRPAESGERGALRASLLDFDGDGAEELLTIRSDGDTALWQSMSLSGFEGPRRTITASPGPKRMWRLGDPSAIPVPADYDGDGKADLATFTPQFFPQAKEGSGNWHVYFTAGDGSSVIDERSSAPRVLTLYWGNGRAKAVPADYDGDGRADIAVFQPEDAVWRILLAAGGFNRAKALLEHEGFGRAIQWGLPEDRPLPADYDGDGCADPAVVRQSDAGLRWLITPSRCKGAASDAVIEFTFGANDATPLAGDFDGDGRADAAVFEPAKKRWQIRSASGAITRAAFFVGGAEAFSGDFDGDGRADPALFVPNGRDRFLILHSSVDAGVRDVIGMSPPAVTRLRWGAANERPVQLILSEHLR